jgi:hypothetical protein
MADGDDHKHDDSVKTLVYRDHKSDDSVKTLVYRSGAALKRVREARERVIARLSEHFAADTLEVEEFERRVTLAHTSDSPEAIEALLADLPALGDGAKPPATAGPTVVASLVPADQDRQSMFAVFGGVQRGGTWTVPRQLRVTAAMGGVQLDLREARFPPGGVDLHVRAVFGGIDIIVPPGLAVQMHGSAIMGGFAQVDRSPAAPDPEAPMLRVHGIAIMGGVDVRMMLPGESEAAAHRRQKRELRAERRGQRQLPEPDK